MKKKRERVRQFMLEEYERFAPTLDQYQWPWETARWHWLAVCLLERLDDSPASFDVARETADIFAALDLLEIEDLARLAADRDVFDELDPQIALMLGILERQGYDEKEAEVAVTTLCEAAHSLQEGFQGKVQKYLRQYGEQLLAEVPAHFTFSRLEKDDVRFAFTRWMQDVLNMPMALSHPSVQALCEMLGVEARELVEIADHNDVNLALIDDWATEYIARSEMLEATSEATA